MSQEYITIQEASELSNKSIQTIRRAIKAKKIQIKRKKTPQGFNYLISRDSVFTCYGLRQKEAPKTNESEVKNLREEIAEALMTEKKAETFSVSANDFRDFTRTMERLIAQHHEERKSFLGLVNTMQEKIFVLENQINLLRAGGDGRKWYQFWR